MITALLATLAGILILYFAIGAIYLAFFMEAGVLRPGDSHPGAEQARLIVAADPDREIIVRRFGPRESLKLAVFFPGRLGELKKYERSFLPSAQILGVTVYAISYPGQDGSRGSTRLTTMEPAIIACIAEIERDCGRPRGAMVYVGHSIGATMAIFAAQNGAPKGVVVDGASPSMAHAVRASLRVRALTRLLTLAPLRRLLPVECDIRPPLQALASLPVVIFQGTQDVVTPLADIEAACSSLANVTIIPVEGAGHDDAWIRAEAKYAATIESMASH